MIYTLILDLRWINDLLEFFNPFTFGSRVNVEFQVRGAGV